MGKLFKKIVALPLLVGLASVLSAQDTHWDRIKDMPRQEQSADEIVIYANKIFKNIPATGIGTVINRDGTLDGASYFWDFNQDGYDDLVVSFKAKEKGKVMDEKGLAKRGQLEDTPYDIFLNRVPFDIMSTINGGDSYVVRNRSQQYEKKEFKGGKIPRKLRF